MRPKVPRPGSIEYNTMRLKAQGEAAALEKQKAQEMAQKAAERKIEHRFEIIKILITIAATLFVEHFVEIFQFFKELLQGLFLP